MALMKEGLWKIVTEEETEPTTGAAEIAKFRSRRDKALATIVLSVDTALLYLISNPEDPAAVWKKLANQFEKKTWGVRMINHFTPTTPKDTALYENNCSLTI